MLFRSSEYNNKRVEIANKLTRVEIDLYPEKKKHSFDKYINMEKPNSYGLKDSPISKEVKDLFEKSKKMFNRINWEKTNDTEVMELEKTTNELHSLWEKCEKFSHQELSNYITIKKAAKQLKVTERAIRRKLSALSPQISAKYIIKQGDKILILRSFVDELQTEKPPKS